MSDNGGNLDPARHMQLPEEEKSYALSGKIMLTAIIILFAVVVFLVILHLYARWYLLRVRRRYLHHRRSRRQRATHLIFYVDPNNPNNATLNNLGRGLGAEVLNSLPVFIYSKKDGASELAPVECAVCLSEFEENEKGRNLPKCNHSFHTECIDMWFASHSTCPLCRSPVEPIPAPECGVNMPEVTAETGLPESSSGFCSTCQNEEDEHGATSLNDRRKGLDITVDVPKRTELDNELRLSSPASSGFRSPGTRLLSLKRILSMNRKGGVGPSCGNESDIESGGYELTQPQTRAQIPR